MELNRDDFKAWLEANPNIRFFDAGSSVSCPIAKFIIHKTGLYSASVALNDYYTYEHDSINGLYIVDDRKPLPEWAQSLIRITARVDTTPTRILKNLERVHVNSP